MAYDAVIFDIDGTLWNATSSSAKGWNLGLEELGMSQRVTAAQIQSVSGYTFERCVDILLPGEKANHPELLSVFNERETGVLATEGGLFYDGVIKGVIHLAQDYRIFLVSNCAEWYINLFLKFSQLGPVLSGVDCYGMSGLAKDDMLRRMIHDNRLKNPLYVGDTTIDEKAAVSAGITFIYAAWGFGKPVGSPRSASSFAELLNLIIP
jgi:phosphoglycolate phosphatase